MDEGEDSEGEHRSGKVVHLKMKAHQVKRCDSPPILVGALSKLEFQRYDQLSVRVADISWLEGPTAGIGSFVLDIDVPELGAQVQPEVHSVWNQFKFQSV